MLTLEEYISKRKQIDNLDEKNINNKKMNMSVCINYVTDYFERYIDTPIEESKTISGEIKVASYRKKLEGLSKESQDYLVKIYLEHGNHIDRLLKRIIESHSEYFLLSSDDDFLNYAQMAFPIMIRKYPYLNNHIDELFLILKDFQNRFWESKFELISKDFNNWVYETKKKYNVDIAKFGYQHASHWLMNERAWEKQARILEDKEYDIYHYDWKKAKDPFDISVIYSKYKQLPYIKNHKKDLEMAVMYFWCTSICGLEDDLRIYIQNFIEV